MEEDATQAQNVPSLRLRDLSCGCIIENQRVRFQFPCQDNGFSLTPPDPRP